MLQATLRRAAACALLGAATAQAQEQSPIPAPAQAATVAEPARGDRCAVQSVIDPRIEELLQADPDDPQIHVTSDTGELGRAGDAELRGNVQIRMGQRLLTADQSRANLVVRTGEVGSGSVRALTTALEQRVAPGALPAGLRGEVTGNAILLSRSADGIAQGQLLAVLLAATSIFLLILAALRSLPLAVIAMIPNVVPVLLFFGLLGAGVAPLSLPTSLIASVALGIAIDDTVHYILRYRAERLAGRTPEEASQRASRSVGTAIVTACTMLVVGYSIIAFSGFATLREFGLLSAGTMLLCLATDLILLPALLLRWRV